MDIAELAQMLSDEIDESGKTWWSAKDVKEFFLSQGINLPLYTILDVWEACPNPVCASKLLGCDAAIFASTGYDAFTRQSDMEEALTPIFRDFMEKWGETIGDYEELEELVSSCLEHWAVSSDYFEA